jgi:hypothetical protein
VTRAEAELEIETFGPRVKSRYGYDYHMGWAAGLRKAAEPAAVVAAVARPVEIAPVLIPNPFSA